MEKRKIRIITENFNRVFKTVSTVTEGTSHETTVHEAIKCCFMDRLCSPDCAACGFRVSTKEAICIRGHGNSIEIGKLTINPDS